MRILQPLTILLFTAGSLIACADSGGRGRAASAPRPDSTIPAAQDSTPAIATDSPARRDSPAPARADTAAPSPLRTGRHDLTLQWIGWNAPGKAIVSASEDGWYDVEGEQRDRSGDYLRLSGGLKVISEKELLFRGTIETHIGHNNGGQPCIKKGEQRFLSTKGRKYWRLQNMATCGEANTVDYVDLYF